MDHITQLKQIRAEAISRLRNSDDFKLAGKLGQLIVELGDTVDDVSVFGEAAIPAPSIAPSTLDDAGCKKDKSSSPTFETAFLPVRGPDYEELKSEEIIEELVAEFEEETAELDAMMSEDSSTEDDIEEVEEIEESEENDEAEVEEEDLAAADTAEQFNGLKDISAYFKTDKTDTGLANGAAH